MLCEGGHAIAAAKPDGRRRNRGTVTTMRALAFWLSLTAVLATLIIAPFLLYEAEITAWVEAFRTDVHGRVYVAAFVVVALVLDVVLPVPSSLVIAFAGATLGVVAGTVVAWLGMTGGCIWAYAMGRRGGSALGRSASVQPVLEQAQRWAARYGPLAIVLTRPVPVLAEIAAVYAGMTRVEWTRFVVYAGLANVGVAGLYAGLGAAGRSEESFALAFAASLLLPGVGWAVARARRSSP